MDVFLFDRERERDAQMLQLKWKRIRKLEPSVEENYLGSMYNNFGD